MAPGGGGRLRALAALYDEPDRFRKTVDLARMRFGAGGAYRYFAAPLPRVVAGMRAALYALLDRLAQPEGEWRPFDGSAARRVWFGGERTTSAA